MCLSALLTAVAFGQMPRNLADYLGSNPWSVAEKGPLFVLDPKNVDAVNDEGGFASYDRKKVKIGELTVLAPRTMVVVDDSLSQPPNMYDGLPMSAKVIYLLQSLTDSQWSKVSSSGIGLADLEGEQTRVFQSILPKPFNYEARKVIADRGTDKIIGQWTLADEDLSKVKLKVQREMEFRPLLAGKENAYSWLTSRDVKGKPGDVTYRETRDPKPPTDVYGAQIRTVADNKLKISQLDYTSEKLAVTIPVPESTTIAEITHAIGDKCGIEIIPDFRVAKLPIRFYGSKATAHDLLQAIAISIEGTYRRVGTAYVLTADLIGMGVRQYRIDYFGHILNLETERRETLWRQQIGSQGRLNKVPFNPNDVLTPNQDLAAELPKADSDYKLYKVSTSLMTPQQRQELDAWASGSFSTPIQKDQIGIASKYTFHFVLPGGIDLATEQELGLARRFGPPVNLYATPIPTLPIALTKNQKLTLMAATEDVEGARKILAAVSKLPVARLWIDTHNAEALTTAVKLAKDSGFEVGLALRPWRVRTDSPDCTILGERGQTVIDRVASLEQGPIHFNYVTGQIGVWMTPSSAAVDAEWRREAELASTPGICGVTLLETQPLGYEPTHPADWVSFFGTMDWGAAAHGFTIPQRLSFLREKGMDPIDFGEDMYARSAFAEHPFIRGDDMLREPVQTLHNDWRMYLAKMNQQATEKLVSLIGDKVMYFEQRLTSINMQWQTPNPVVEWKRGMPLPWTLPIINDQIVAKNTGYRHVYLPIDPALQGPLAPGTWISDLPPSDGSAPKDNPLLIDLEFIPLRQLTTTLGKWFKTE